MGETLHKLGSAKSLARLVLAAVLVGLALPILAGLSASVLASLGYFPAIGARAFSLATWQELFALPGFASSLKVTLISGIGSTLLALVLALALVSQNSRPRLIAPLLAAPHAALAIGFGFLIAPSGWIFRLLGVDSPPQIATIQDPNGIALLLGLTIKELPFLLLISLSAMASSGAEAKIRAARALGYSRMTAFVKCALPSIYPLIRLPIFVVLAFALSVVDMAIVLGPSNPPTIAVLALRLFHSPDIANFLPASAAGIFLLILVMLVILLWRLVEILVAHFGRKWIFQGHRSGASDWLLPSFAIFARATLVTGLIALALLLIWSVAWRWPFPEILPAAYSLDKWLSPAQSWGTPFMNALLIGLLSVIISLLLAIFWLEAEDKLQTRRAGWAVALIYLPLLLPQIAFLSGLNTALLDVGLKNGLASVIWVHVLFVFPYIMIALSEPWKALDPRFLSIGASLGLSPLRRFFRIKLPLLLRPLLIASSIGFAVSIAQYLPTLFIGAGRVETLTTEAVALSSSGDRRIIGLLGALQALLPLIGFGLALFIPARLYRDRKAMGAN